MMFTSRCKSALSGWSRHIEIQFHEGQDDEGLPHNVRIDGSITSSSFECDGRKRSRSSRTYFINLRKKCVYLFLFWATDA